MEQVKYKTYDEFLASKVKAHIDCGFEVEAMQLNPALFPFQRYIVPIALKKGRFAVFADCGLGKTLMQLEWSRQVVTHTEKPVLILAPLAVTEQTKGEADRFGLGPVVECPPAADGLTVQPGIYITNYEQLGNIDTSLFAGIVLDESSILKNEEGATRNLIIELFSDTPYKLCCTATPSPNDPMELGNHSEFLGVMSRAEMLAMYFIHDGGDTSQWRLKGHAQDRFWQFVSTWAIMLSRPSDIGFSDEGYVLPDLVYHEHQIITEKRDNGQLYNDKAVSAGDHNAELRATMDARMAKVAELVNGSSEAFIVWIKQDPEGDALRRLIPDAVEVRGSDKPEVKKKNLLAFAAGAFRVLITKARIAQFGLNYQHCRNQVFPSLDFSFEGLYQSIRRSYRFGQTQAVNIHLITSDTMQNVRDSIRRKQSRHEEMQQAMQKHMNGCFTEEVTRVLTPKRTIQAPDMWLMEGDCVRRIKEIPDESVGFSIFSPPFAELYTYSDELEDMGNSKDYNEFFTAFSFLVPELYRVLWSGRNVAVHCMDLPVQKGKEGYIGLRDFPAMIREAFERAGFIFHSRVTIWKDPVVEMQRTKALGLLHKQVKKDAAMSRVGLPDYLMVFRKPGEHAHPVRCNIPVDLWQKYASPVWMDIDYGDTLNGRKGRGDRDEKHICPLQLPTIERAAHLWSNPGDWVLSPFGGIGSEGFQAIKMGRKSISMELKASYFDLNIKNHKAAKEGKNQLLLIDDLFTNEPAA
ncbi:DNA methyltransferase [Flaviaesturariibacter amylovorans]|uniref:Helicase ATP-binding domain-containing protein n=1 Tax=Flaviaesturariibacter amylovorans TaxID=1084520 RepID=A0ABP8GQA9_9BACT